MAEGAHKAFLPRTHSSTPACFSCFASHTSPVMPRENRKRGKKHKKKAEEVADQHEDYAPQDEELEPDAGPSWILPDRDHTALDQNAPFGFVDAEVKAYFRTVDVQIREWQETKPEVEADEDIDPNEGASHCVRFTLHLLT